MSKQTPGTLLMIGAFATVVAIIAITGMTILSELSFSAALTLAFFLWVAVAVVLFRGFHARDLPPPNQSTAIERAAETQKGKPGPTAFQTAGPGHSGAAAEAASGGMTDADREQRDHVESDLVPGDEGATTDDDANRQHADRAENSGGAGGAVGQSKSLPGQDELSSRKGEWRYEGGAEASGEAAESEGRKPPTMDSPPEGGGDDLKRINGIGPKIEDMLHGMGIYTFGQIASWSDDELAWVDSHLEGFKGRASRDDWIGQARELSSGARADQSGGSTGGQSDVSAPAVHTEGGPST